MRGLKQAASIRQLVFSTVDDSFVPRLWICV